MFVYSDESILIAGDSWGVGEWDYLSATVLHKGLEQYLSDKGYKVKNISAGGTSNLDNIHRIENYLIRNPENTLSKIIIFQTEWTRDFKHNRMQQDYGSNDWDDIKTVEDLSSRWIERFYHRLSEISIKNNIPVWIIGGSSDTMWFDDMNIDYPGCHIACQSSINLILTNHDKINLPVYSWFCKKTESLVKILKQSLPNESINELLDLIDLGFERESMLWANPEYFYPDGKHLNRQGHYKLFQYLESKKIL